MQFSINTKTYGLIAFSSALHYYTQNFQEANRLKTTTTPNVETQQQNVTFSEQYEGSVSWDLFPIVHFQSKNTLKFA